MPPTPAAAFAALGPAAPTILSDTVADVLTYPNGPPAEAYTGPGDDPAATKTRRRVVTYSVAGQIRTATGTPAQGPAAIVAADLAANPLPAEVTDWVAKITAAQDPAATDRQVLDAILATLVRLARRAAQ